jgi:hypothetical protein
MTDHESRLRAMVAPDQAAWDFSPADVAAIRWVMDLACQQRERAEVAERKLWRQQGIWRYQGKALAEQADRLRLTALAMIQGGDPP